MLQLNINDKSSYSIENKDGNWEINGSGVDLDISRQANGLISVLLNGKSYTAIVENINHSKKEITVRIDGQIYKSKIKEPIDQLLSNMGLDTIAKQKAEVIKAPMPGMVIRILVQPNQSIKKGDGLLILEAMKMENILKASEDGTVKSIKVAERTAVEKGMVLIEMGS
jgi:biotin carboxyl carrier protein